MKFLLKCSESFMESEFPFVPSTIYQMYTNLHTQRKRKRRNENPIKRLQLPRNRRPFQQQHLHKLIPLLPLLLRR